MEQKEKRRQRAYKVSDSIYDKAMKRAKKEGGTIANFLENILISYSYGLDIHAVNNKPRKTKKQLSILEDPSGKVLIIKKY